MERTQRKSNIINTDSLVEDICTNKIYSYINSTNKIFEKKNYEKILLEIYRLIKDKNENIDIYNELLNTIYPILNFSNSFFLILTGEKILFEKIISTDLNLKNYLLESGLIKLAVEENKSFFLLHPELSQSNLKNVLLIPVNLGKEFKGVFCFVTDKTKEGIFSENFYLIEIILFSIGNHLFNKFMNSYLEELNKLSENQKVINEQSLKYSVVGKMCFNSFHNLKNKVQILVSSFDILRKLSEGRKDERLEKIFSILETTIPEYSKIIKSISDTSKFILSENESSYFEIKKFIIKLLEFIRLTNAVKKIKISMDDNFSDAKIYFSENLLFQILIQLFMDLDEFLTGNLIFKSYELQNNLLLNLRFVFDLTKDINDFLIDEKLSSKFAGIRDILHINSSSFVINLLNDRTLEFLIKLPLRSSQSDKN